MEKSVNYEIDMTTGSVSGKLIKYAVPLILSGILQLLFNAVDIIVVGRFAGSTCMAAVGSTATIIATFTNLFIGIASGVNVIAAQRFASSDDDGMQKTVQTAMVQALFFGVLLMAVGIVSARTVLTWMGSPAEVIDMSVLYLRIYYIGMPFFMIYNFGAAVLKAVGDTKRPLFYLLIAGVINAGLNVVLVACFHMDVAGVALATIFSQLISCVLVVRTLMKSQGAYRLDPHRIHYDGSISGQILKVGVPAGLQSVIVAFSNVLIQSSVNSFGVVAMAAFTAICSLREFAYVTVNAISQTAMSFVSQNYAVKDFSRIRRITGECLIMTFAAGTLIGGGICLLGINLVGIYTDDSAVISCAISILPLALLMYGFCGTMDLFPGAMRGMKYSLTPMIIQMIGVVAFRFVWIFAVFPKYHTLENLFLSFPVSWVMTTIMQAIAYIIIVNKEEHNINKKGDQL